jgi:ABC-type polysaccharide/polyol phosphate export permease
MLMLLMPVLTLVGLGLLVGVIVTLSQMAPAYGFLVQPVLWVTTIAYIVRAAAQARRH